MFDAKELKNNLTLEDYEKIMFELGAEPKKRTTEYIIYNTGDHHLDWEDGSPKLYFYIETKSFFSYTASCSFDIIGLVEKRWELEGLDYTFNDILVWIANVVGLSTDTIEINKKSTQCSWKTMLSRYTNRKPTYYTGKIYDKSELSLCLPYYHQSFIDDGISIETMQKFQIGWYPPRAQISIPVFSDSGDLLGVNCRNTTKIALEKGRKYFPLITCKENYKLKTSEMLYGVNVNKPWIEQSKQVLIFEAQKSVLQLDSMYGHSNAVAIFGTNLSTIQRNMIVGYGVNEVVICLDKQYEQAYEMSQDENTEWTRYCKTVQKIAKLFKGYAKVSAVVDMGDMLEYKDSPSDKGKAIWETLFKERYEI